VRRPAALAVALALAGCHGAVTDTGSGGTKGRYAGIGVYDAGGVWRHMSGAPDPGDLAGARIADDEHVVVVVDTVSGEVRQCGDHSGFCVAMNPWAKRAPALPASLARHAAELEAEGDAATANDTAD